MPLWNIYHKILFIGITIKSISVSGCLLFGGATTTRSFLGHKAVSRCFCRVQKKRTFKAAVQKCNIFYNLLHCPGYQALQKHYVIFSLAGIHAGLSVLFSRWCLLFYDVTFLRFFVAILPPVPNLDDDYFVLSDQIAQPIATLAKGDE